MKLRFLSAVLPVALVLGGCSVNSDLDDGNKPDTGAVKNVPLEGRLDGQTFKGKVALVLNVQGAPDDRQINIYGVDAACDNQPTDAPGVFFRVKKWAPGLAYNLDFDSMVSLRYKKDVSPLLSMNGRVEVAASGQSLGVRAINSEDSQVEGTITLTVCP